MNAKVGGQKFFPTSVIFNRKILQRSKRFLKK